MKKLLLATALTAAFASSAFAENDAFYVRLDAGAGMAPQQKYQGGVDKLKSSTHFVGGLGVGVYLMENVRTELSLSNHFSVNQTSKGNAAGKDKLKATATSVHIKGLVDVYDYGMGQLFVGAGAGLTQLGAKLTHSTPASAAGVVPAVAATSTTYKAKKSMGFSWLLTAGTAFDVAEGVKLDVAYTYENAGSTKALKAGNASYGKYKFSSHNLTAGVRFEL